MFMAVFTVVNGMTIFAVVMALTKMCWAASTRDSTVGMYAMVLAITTGQMVTLMLLNALMMFAVDMVLDGAKTESKLGS